MQYRIILNHVIISSVLFSGNNSIIINALYISKHSPLKNNLSTGIEYRAKYMCVRFPFIAWYSNIRHLHLGGIPWVSYLLFDEDVIKWKHFQRYRPFVRGILRWPVNSSRKGQWRGALVFSLIHAWTNGWANNRDAGDLRRHRTH